MIIRFVHSCGKAGAWTRCRGVRRTGLRLSPIKGEKKVNKGDVAQERASETVGAWRRSMERREKKNGNRTQREGVTLTHGRIRSCAQWRKNKKNSFTEAGQRHLQSWGVDHRISSYPTRFRQTLNAAAARTRYRFSFRELTEEPCCSRRTCSYKQNSLQLLLTKMKIGCYF